MKTYANGKKATEFNRKQIGAIYRLAKAGELKVEKWAMSRMYDLSDFYGFDQNNMINIEEGKIQRIIEAVFSEDLKEAQQLIDWYTRTEWETYSTKWQTKANRNLVHQRL